MFDEFPHALFTRIPTEAVCSLVVLILTPWSTSVGGPSQGAQIHNLPTRRPLSGLEMGNKGLDIIVMFPRDAVFDLPEFLDDFVRHLQLLP